MKIYLKYIFNDPDRHGNERVYVRRDAPPRSHQRTGNAGLDVGATGRARSFEAPHEQSRINGRIIVPGSLAALAAKYFASIGFSAAQRKVATQPSQHHRDLLRETLPQTVRSVIPRKLFNASHMRWLMECEEPIWMALPTTAASIYRPMFAWAVQQSPPLITRNAARDVRVTAKKTDGFYTWTDDDVPTFEASHPIGSKARLALALLMYTGRGDRRGPYRP